MIFIEHGSWYKDSCYWRNKSLDWEVANYGEPVNGKGDLISNTMMRIIEQGDKSSWAYNSLMYCQNLLRNRKRWPDRMNQNIDAKSSIQWRWSKQMQKLEVNKTVKYRPQHHMTRDGFIYTICCAVHLDRIDIIKKVRIPWYLYRPSVFAWRRYLIKPNKWSEFWYKLGIKIPAKRDYVKRLNEFMFNAYTLRKAE